MGANEDMTESLLSALSLHLLVGLLSSSNIFNEYVIVEGSKEYWRGWQGWSISAMYLSTRLSGGQRGQWKAPTSVNSESEVLKSSILLLSITPQILHQQARSTSHTIPATNILDPTLNQ